MMCLDIILERGSMGKEIHEKGCRLFGAILTSASKHIHENLIHEKVFVVPAARLVAEVFMVAARELGLVGGSQSEQNEATDELSRAFLGMYLWVLDGKSPAQSADYVNLQLQVLENDTERNWSVGEEIEIDLLRAAKVVHETDNVYLGAALMSEPLKKLRARFYAS